jgi:hypothetical protein
MNFSNFPNSIDSKMQQVNVNYDPYVIKPPDRNKTHGSISRHIVIDSRDRDYLLYPNSNKYRVEIPQEFKDITSMELSLAQIPNTFYNINEKNNIVYIGNKDLQIFPFEVKEGQYNNSLLIDALNGKYGDIFMNLPFKLNFSRDPINLKLRIQANIDYFTYNLNYSINDFCSPCRINSIDKTIGFLNKQYTSSIIDLSNIKVNTIEIISGESSNQAYQLYKLKADKIYNGIEVDFTSIFFVNDYFILEDPVTHQQYQCQIYEINNDNTIVFEELDGLTPTNLNGLIFNNISVIYSENIFQVENKPYVILKVKDVTVLNSIGAANNAFTLIPLLNLENTIVNQATIPVHGVIKYFNPPLSKLLWLDIEFVNYDGSLFNFRGQENMLLFIVTMLNQPGKYNNYIDSN